MPLDTPKRVFKSQKYVFAPWGGVNRKAMYEGR